MVSTTPVLFLTTRFPYGKNPEADTSMLWTVPVPAHFCLDTKLPLWPYISTKSPTDRPSTRIVLFLNAFTSSTIMHCVPTEKT